MGTKSSVIAPPSFLSSSPAPPDLRQALVPVEKKLVPVRRPVWGQLCLCPLHPQRLRWAPARRQSEGGGQTSGRPGSPGPHPKHRPTSPPGPLGTR